MAINLTGPSNMDLFNNFEKDQTVNAPQDAELFRVASLAKQQQEAMAKVQELELNLKKAKADLRQVEQFDLPNLMDELGLSEFKLKDGGVVKIVENLSMSIPKKRFSECVNWLVKNGLSALVSRDVVVPFKKGQEVAYEACSLLLAQAEIEFKSQEKVNTASVKAAFNEKISQCRDDGVDWLDENVIPLKKFGGYLVRKSKLS